MEAVEDDVEKRISVCEIEVIHLLGKVNGVYGNRLKIDAHFFAQIGSERNESFQGFFFAVADHKADFVGRQLLFLSGF